jgi:1-acyl-sn-glycerol-3-phosphate acyltransferase
MFSRIFRGWRVLATGLSFAIFGLGGVLLLVLGFPILFLLIPRQQRRQKVARRLIHALFWLFVRFMWVIGVLRFRITGGERLKGRSKIIVANHPSLLDVVFLISLVPEATCIVRAGLARNPFTHAPVRLAGYICNDWGAALVDACVEALHSGSSLIVFPEGTRTDETSPHKWHRGAANIALRAGIPLTPVRIQCDPPTLRKGEPWWRVPARRVQYFITVLDDLPVSGGAPQREPDPRVARDLTAGLQEELSGRAEQNVRA